MVNGRMTKGFRKKAQNLPRNVPRSIQIGSFPGASDVSKFIKVTTWMHISEQSNLLFKAALALRR